MTKLTKEQIQEINSNRKPTMGFTDEDYEKVNKNVVKTIIKRKMKYSGLYDADGNQLSVDDVIAILPTDIINRVEVIDENGRSYVNWKHNNKTELSLQDDGRTLKVFISQK